LKAIMAWLATADQRVKAESGLTHYIDEIRRVPMLEPQDEYMLAKRWREHDDLEAAHKLVNSHLRLVARIAKGYRGYGLPISELIAEGNVGLMQAVKRFEPEKGFRLATYATWWIKAAIQEYILRSWSLVKMGTTANQKKLFFNLRKAKSKISVLDEGDLRPDQVKLVARRLDVTEQDVVDMNRRLRGDVSLDAHQARVALDLDAPAVIVGQVQLQNVELVERHQVEHLEDELLGQEVPRDVDEQAAPGEARRIFDGDARHAPARVADGGAPEDLRWHQLEQRLDSVKRPGRGARADRDAADRDIELIAFQAEACQPAGEPQLDPVSGRTADDREVVVGRRRQRILQQARLAKQRLVRDDRGPDAELECAGLGLDCGRPRNDRSRHVHFLFWVCTFQGNHSTLHLSPASNSRTTCAFISVGQTRDRRPIHHIPGFTSRLEFAEIHVAVMATSPNFYNVSRAVTLKPIVE
jgi:RNA polymerase sigma-32 factor